ncbi:DUF4231 domain-containing protein [Streptomyces sp. NPDC090073]|uniref:DUF4231 domain-containing protein n=1 Tax=Streptomyces sp. NPDC090073 TaxID=3365936 RepID=UPI0037F5A15B
MRSQPWWEDLPRVTWPEVPPSVTTRGTWYQQNMRSARWKARLLDLAILVLAAGVPFAVAIKAGNWVVALLGFLTSLLTGARHVFDPQGDWIRFSRASLQIETEVVRYKQALNEYGDAAAAPGTLAARVEDICAEETGAWAQRLPRPATSGTTRVTPDTNG